MEAITAEQQLAEIREEIESASKRVEEMRSTLSAESWQRKPDPTSWSAIECIEHLNKTNVATLLRVREGLGGLADMPKHRGVYHLDLFGWLLVKSLGSKSRFSKSKTAAPFVPANALDVDPVLEQFGRLQSELLEVIHQAAGVPLDAHKMQSVFEARIKYNLYSALRIVAVHETRHIDQAERATLVTVAAA